MGEQSRERLTRKDRERVADELPRLQTSYAKLLLPEGIARAFVKPPQSPGDCLFSRMSMNYSADLQTRVEPCVFGGNPDCTQCGCSISSALHWIRDVNVAGPLKVGHLVGASLTVGSALSKLRGHSDTPNRWQAGAHYATQRPRLVQIHPEDQNQAP